MNHTVALNIHVYKLEYKKRQVLNVPVKYFRNSDRIINFNYIR